MKVKVCHIVGGIVGGGVEQVIANYCSMMSNIQFDLLYQYEPNQTCLEKLCKANINCIQIPSKKLHPIRHFLVLFMLLKKGRYDVVHSHLDWYLNWIVCFCALLVGVKKRFSHHHHDYQEKTVACKILCEILRFLNRLFATHYLACSPQAAISGWGLKTFKDGKIYVINNAMNLKKFEFDLESRCRIRKELDLEGKFCIGHVGRCCYQKNQKFLVEIFSKIHKLKNNTVLILVGDGPDKEYLKKRIDSMHLTDSVRFIEAQENVAPYYSAMDVFCLPSRWEGLGMVLVEAQLNGLSCVASDTVPRSAQISNGVDFFNLANPGLWVSRICEMSKFDHSNVCNAKDFDIEFECKVLEQLYCG